MTAYTGIRYMSLGCLHYVIVVSEDDKMNIGRLEMISRKAKLFFQTSQNATAFQW